jgi:hypothetical protein
MDISRVSNKHGYFFDGFTLLIGYIGGEGSIYFKYLSGKVIYSKPLYFSRSWNHGYKHDNWDWSPFEFIPTNAFRGLDGYLSFLEGANIDEIKAYFKLKEVMQTEDFKECGIKL